MRLHFLDNFRFALTVLVICHHTAVAYGGGGDWPYRSRQHEFSLPLFAFTAINQTYFMGTFFFISGIFSRLALARKGPKGFIIDKLLRLGGPALVYTLVATPLQDAILKLVIGHQFPSVGVIWEHLEALRADPGVRGPVWYLGLLCLFDLTYAVSSASYSRKPVTSGSLSQEHTERNLIKSGRSSHIVFGILLCGFVSFLVRLQYPTTYVNVLLNLRFGYVPQYIFIYVFGLFVDPAEVELLPRGTIRAILAMIGMIALFTWCMGFDGGEKLLEEFSGGWNARAATYAVQNELVGYLLFAKCFQLFRSYCSASWGPVTNLSFAMFLVHAPVSVVLETLTDSWLAGAVTKAFVIGAANCLCTIITAWLLKQLPGVGHAI